MAKKKKPRKTNPSDPTSQKNHANPPAVAPYRHDAEVPEDHGPTAEQLQIIKENAAMFMTDADIAVLAGITYMTFLNWKKRYPIILETMARGQAVSKNNVRVAIFSQAKEKSKEGKASAKLWFDYVERVSTKVELSGPDQKPIELKVEPTEDEVIKRLDTLASLLKEKK